jgi:hypothetical protein
MMDAHTNDKEKTLTCQHLPMTGAPLTPTQNASTVTSVVHRKTGNVEEIKPDARKLNSV